MFLNYSAKIRKNMTRVKENLKNFHTGRKKVPQDTDPTRIRHPAIQRHENFLDGSRESTKNYAGFLDSTGSIPLGSDTQEIPCMSRKLT